MNNWKKLLILIIYALFSLSISVKTSFAQTTDYSEITIPFEETMEVVVLNVLEEKEVEVVEEKQLYQRLECLVTKGALKDQKIEIENGNIPITNQQKYKAGDNLVVTYTKDFEGNDIFYITDFVRRNSLLWLFILFAALSLIVAKWKGLTSLLGMFFSFLIIFKFILPNILAGADPIIITIIGSIFIIPVTFYLSHGLNRKTTAAIIGTVLSLIIIGILTGIFVEAAKLTGFASEEAGFLQVMKTGSLNIKGLLLAGIIIGVLGVLDDITVSQSAVVQEIRKTDQKLSFHDLYQKAMRIGKDHIASMVNTLILVYTGASLPLLLLFIDNSRSLLEVINYEIVADEIVRMLVGSIGLVLAVPITTLIASLIIEKEKKI